MRRPDPLTRRALLVPLRLAARAAPRSVQRWASWPFAWALFVALGRVRRAVQANLDVVGRGALSPAERRRRALQTFRHYGQYLLDYLTIPELGRARVPWQVGRVDGEHHVLAGVDAGRGAILTAPHFGLWELGGAYLSSRGHPVSVATAPEPDPGVRAIREEMRKAIGVETITLDPRDGAFGMIPLLSALGKNRIVAILGDRRLTQASIDVEFFGRATPFPLGPAVLARASGAPLVPVFVTLMKDWTYELVAEEPLRVPATPDRARDYRTATQALAARFEGRIARHPEQWYNFFDFWPGERPSPQD